jgi:hypothetical protein
MQETGIPNTAPLGRTQRYLAGVIVADTSELEHPPAGIPVHERETERELRVESKYIWTGTK